MGVQWKPQALRRSLLSLLSLHTTLLVNEHHVKAYQPVAGSCGCELCMTPAHAIMDDLWGWQVIAWSPYNMHHAE